MSEGAEQKPSAVKGATAMVIVMMCGSFLSALNQNLANTALPTFMQVFGVSMGQAQWLITVYTLANGVMIPVTAYLIERFRTRSMYFWAMSLFVLGTLLCALAPSFAVLLVGRVVQALGAGISLTLMQTVLFTVFPVDKRGAAMGYYSLVIAFAPALGPVIAGLIIDSLPWQMLFAVQIPFAAVLMVIAVFVVKNVTGGAEGKLDVFSVVLSTIGFGGVLYGFGSAGGLGFTSPVVLGSIAVGIVGIVWFIVRQLHLETPVLNFRTFTYHGFGSSIVLSIGIWSLFIGLAVLVPLYLQNMLGLSATVSGMTMMAGGITYGVLAPFMGHVLDRFGPRVLIPGGIAVLACSLLALCFIGAGTQPAYVAVAYAFFEGGMAMCSMQCVTCAINTLPANLISHGSAMNNTLRQVVSAIVTAVFVSLLSAFSGGATGAGQIPGLRVVLGIMFVLAAVMFVWSLFVYRKAR